MNKMTRFLMIAGLSIAAAGVVHGQTPPPPPAAGSGDAPAWHGPQGHMEGHGPMGMHDNHGRWGAPWEHREMPGFEAMAILHHLDLTPEQHEKIRAIHQGAWEEGKHLHELLQSDRSALMRVAPTEPAYATAVAAAKEHAAAMVDHRANTWTKVYAVLTPAQRAKIPEMIQKMDARREKAKAHWGHRGDHGPMDGHPAMPPPAPAPGSGPR